MVITTYHLPPTTYHLPPTTYHQPTPALRERHKDDNMSNKIREALAGMLAIVDESRGVDGYHLSGDIAEWDTFPEVAAARAALAQQPAQVAVPDELRQHILHMRRELTRLDRSPLNVRQRLAQRVTELLAAAAPAATVAVQELPQWEPCNPACDPELNGSRSKRCDCAQAKAMLSATPAPAAQETIGWWDSLGAQPIRWADGILRGSFPDGTPIYAAPPAAEQPYSATSDRYRAELYDEVWSQARLIGFGNVTDALAELQRMKLAEQPDTVAVRELIDLVMRCDITGGGVLAAQRAAHALLGKEGA